jgi:hypothetical protein
VTNCCTTQYSTSALSLYSGSRARRSPTQRVLLQNRSRYASRLCVESLGSCEQTVLRCTWCCFSSRSATLNNDHLAASAARDFTSFGSRAGDARRMPRERTGGSHCMLGWLARSAQKPAEAANFRRGRCWPVGAATCAPGKAGPQSCSPKPYPRSPIEDCSGQSSRAVCDERSRNEVESAALRGGSRPDRASPSRSIS